MNSTKFKICIPFFWRKGALRFIRFLEKESRGGCSVLSVQWNWFSLEVVISITTMENDPHIGTDAECCPTVITGGLNTYFPVTCEEIS